MKRLIPFLVGVVVAAWGLPSAAQQPADQPAAQPAEAGDAGAPQKQVQGGKFTLEQAERVANEAVSAKLKEASAKRQENIEKLKKLLDNPDYKKDPYRAPKVMHMLAETYWDELLYQYLQKRNDWDKSMESFNAGTLSEKPAEPTEDYAVSLDLYRQILKQFPQYDRIDEVYYYLGKGAMKEGKAKKDRLLQKEGVDYLNRLVQNFPKSKYIPEAHLAMGEYYFENNSLVYAKTNYEKILFNYPKSSMYSYAMYKLGWVYFNLQEFDKSIDTFHKVVEQVSKIQGKGIVEFKNQALNDLVVTYAEVENGWQLAREYFVKVMGETDAYKKLRTLAELYVGQDKDLYAIELYRHFIEREKTTVAIPDYYRTILGIYKKTNDLKNLELVTLEVLEYFKPNGTWATVNQKNDETLAAADALGEEHLLYLANQVYHKEAQRLSKQDLYRKAADMYSLYLSRFSTSKNAYVVNSYYADILYEQLKDYKAAAVQYKKVIERDTKGEFVEDAAMGVIFSYQELMVAAGLQEVARKGNVEVVKVDPKKLDAPIPDTPLHELEQEYVAAADRYVDLVFDVLKDPVASKKLEKTQRGEKLGTSIPEIMYIAAQVYYRHGKFADAVTRLKRIFEYDSSSKFAALSVFTLMDCYQRLQRWEEVDKWARELIAKKNFTVKTERQLREIARIAMTERSKQQVTAGETSEAIKLAQTVYKEARADKDDEAAAKSLYNVAALYEGQRNVDQAIKTYLQVIKEYPKAEIAPEALFTIGVIYESMTKFEDAAATFEKMEQFKANKEPASTDTEKHAAWVGQQKMIADSLINAGLIREALNEPKDAIDAYQKFVKHFPGHVETPRLDLRIGIVYETQAKPDYKKAHDQYMAWMKKKYSRGDLAVEALSRAGTCLKKIDKKKQRKVAIDAYERALEAFKKLADNADSVKYAKPYAAQAAFELADFLYDDFTLLKIPSTLDPYKLKKALVEKAEAQQKAEKAFDHVLDYKSGSWSAGALFKMGLLYYEFAKQLREVPVPDDLPPEVQMEYMGVLDEIARPVWEKSERAFERALKLAHEEKVYNAFSKSCAEYASKVNPDTFPVAGDDQVKADHSKDTLASTSFIRVLRRGNVEVKLQQEAGK